MRQNRQNDRQQTRNTPYQNKGQQQQNNGNGGGQRGGNFQRRSNDNGQMGNNQGSNMNRFNNNNMMDRQSMGGNSFDNGMNSNGNNFNRGGNNFDDNNFSGFGEDRRGFALPSFPNDMGQNNFVQNDRQNNNGMGRRNNGELSSSGKLFFLNLDSCLQAHHSSSAITTTITRAAVAI